MGFGDFLKEVGKMAFDGIKAYGEKNLEYDAKWGERYSVMSDEQLQRERERFAEGGISNNQQEKVVRMNALSREMRDRGLID